MAIAGALIVPVNRQAELSLVRRLGNVAEVEIEIEAVGPKGVAVVMEAGLLELKAVSSEIKAWDEVLDFELAYLNWEEEGQS